ncbi:MAG: HD domain-containing protein [Tissierellia bacterium]|nr:HD domain-containing protein [Tissierellia bacterium]
MKNTNKIHQMDIIQGKIEKLKILEKDRKFCKHNMEHFLSVARICYILCLENKLPVKKDLIYTTALLHDLGRVEEIIKGVDHDKASVGLAKEVLQYTDFTPSEKEEIIGAIGKHRKTQVGKDFASYFYQADKLSRTCYECEARNDCYWSSAKKNMEIKY